MNESHEFQEPRINFTGCTMDPLGEKAEIELRDIDMRERRKKKENRWKENAFIASSFLPERKTHSHFSGHCSSFLNKIPKPQ